MSNLKIPSGGEWKNRYSYAFKMEVIEAIENGKLSKNQASKMYGIHHKTVGEWMKKYGNFDKKLTKNLMAKFLYIHLILHSV